MSADMELRRFRESDAPLLVEAARESMGPLCSWMVWCRPTYCIEDSRSFIAQSRRAWKKREGYCFAITSLTEGTLLGSVGISRIDWAHKVAHLGYWVRSGSTKRGVATAAARQAAEFAFDELGLNRLELLIPFGNRPSRRVAEKLGAQSEGVLRRRLILNGNAIDALLYSVLAPEKKV